MKPLDDLQRQRRLKGRGRETLSMGELAARRDEEIAQWLAAETDEERQHHMRRVVGLTARRILKEEE